MMLALLIGAQLASSVPGPSNAASRALLPARTPVQLDTIDPVDSRSAKQGQRFALRVSDDVRVGTAIVIPKGTPAVGEVEAVSGKGMVGKAGRLVLQPLFVEIAGERIYLVGANEERGKDSTAGVAVGSLLLSGWGIFITGKSASVPAGSPLPGRTRTDVTLPVVQIPTTPVSSTASEVPAKAQH
jgi:hypothetical protein